MYPSEVENALMTHPAVRECAVIGMADKKWVEAVTAVVVVREGTQPSEDELIDHVAQQLASFDVLPALSLRLPRKRGKDGDSYCAKQEQAPV